MIKKINCLPDLVEMNLSRKGHRITTARKYLIEYILSLNTNFFTINEYKKKNPNVNVATFYNNINLLIEINVLGKIKNAEETKYYLKSRVNIIKKCNNCDYEELIKLNTVPNFKIDNIVQYDCTIYVSKCCNCQS